MFNINRDSKNKEEQKDIKVEQQPENKAVADDTGKQEEHPEKNNGADGKVMDQKEAKAELRRQTGGR
jgi:hypothetical protein